MTADLHELSDWPSCVTDLSKHEWPSEAFECDWPSEHDWLECAEGQPAYINDIMYQ